MALARSLFQQNRPADAERELRQILRDEPGSIPAQALLGVICAQSGRVDEAEPYLQVVLWHDPRQVDAVGWLALVKRTQGDLRAAISLYERAIELGRRTPHVYSQLGLCKLQIEDAPGAGAAFMRAIELDRSSARNHFYLGMALKLSGTSYETFLTFKRAAELDPQPLETYVELWHQMRQLLNWTEGVSLMEEGLRRHPDSTQMKMILAAIYGKLGDKERAEDLFQRTAEMDASAEPPYAHWLQEEGRFEDSVEVLKEAVRRHPVQGQAYYNLAVAKSFELNGNALQDAVLPLLEEPAITAEERMFLHYALAKSHDQSREYELAMRHYDAANDLAFRLYNSHVDWDAEAVRVERETIARLYSRENLEAFRRHGSKSTRPIFIVGMIRTGTTLLDQILSSHPSVRSAGEQPFWQVSSGPVNRRWVDNGFNPKDVRELEAAYLEVLRINTGDSPKSTDKMPTNFNHIGLMSTVFPRAKFIHLRRNPLDTCLSIYTTFLGSGTQFAYNQENIVRYYRAYQKMMEHWRTVVAPDQMIEIDYEELVADRETVLRRLLSFCGLEWDDALMRHESNRSQVSTPSLWAVRQPVSTSSVERWRKYEPWLGQLIELQE